MCARVAGARRMAVQKAATFENVRVAWPDTRLVRECLRGSEEAWSALIDKYKNLIFSIPIKYGFSADDAAEIFQVVCVELLTELPKLRESKALPKWLTQITAHKCFHRKREQQRTETSGDDEEGLDSSIPARAEGILRQAEEEQSLRDAIFGLPPRCRQLIEMLFFEEPPRPYEQVARDLGIATGSVGFIRQRCLERLRKQLGEAGFQ